MVTVASVHYSGAISSGSCARICSTRAILFNTCYFTSIGFHEIYDHVEQLQTAKAGKSSAALTVTNFTHQVLCAAQYLLYKCRPLTMYTQLRLNYLFQDVLIVQIHFLILEMKHLIAILLLHHTQYPRNKITIAIL